MPHLARTPSPPTSSHSASEDHLGSGAGLFLLSSPAGHTSARVVHEPACNAILQALARDTDPRGLTIGYAEDVLVPEPEPSKRNGGPVLNADTIADANALATSPSDSPTKLWSMWSLQDV